MTTDPEVTVFCIDNAAWLYGGPILKAQIDAIKFYCETKFKCNPKNLVGIFVMGSLSYGTRLFPTNDLKKVMRCLEVVHCDFGGKTDFEAALSSSSRGFFRCPEDMKRRLIMFVGTPIKLHDIVVKPYGETLKKRRVALNIFNFFVFDKKKDRVDYYDILYGTYHYARRELVDLVVVVNDEGNSVIVDVDESSVIDKLSRFILRMKQDERYAEDNVNVEQELELHHNDKNKKGAKGKVGSYEERSVEDNVSFEQELELHHNEKNKKSAKGEVGSYKERSAEDNVNVELHHNEKNEKGAKGEVGSYVMHVCCLIAAFPLLICLCWAEKQGII